MRTPIDIRRSPSRPGSASKRKLPIPGATGFFRIAQVSVRPALFDDCRVFAAGDLAALHLFRPEVLVGSTLDLEQVAREVGHQAVDLASVDRAVFVITDCRDVPLRDTSRVLFWQTFGVPVFEMLLNGDGVPVATECEAHEGWHVEDGVTFSSIDDQLWFNWKRSPLQGTGLTGTVDGSLCPCGRPGKRILDAAMDYRDPVRHHLARSA